MDIIEEFENFKKVPKFGLHKIPKHILAISRYGYLSQELLDVLCKQIANCEYNDALNTIHTMHLLLSNLPHHIAFDTNKRTETILRLNSIKYCLKPIYFSNLY